MKVNLLFISDTFIPDNCGVADYLNIVINSLDKDLFNIHVITRTDIKGNPKIYSYDNVTVHKILDSRYYMFNPSLYRYITGINPNIIDIQMSYSGSSKFARKNIFIGWIVPLIKLFIRNTKIVVTVHEVCQNIRNKNTIEKVYSFLRDQPYMHFCNNFISADVIYKKYLHDKNYIILNSFSNIPTCIRETAQDNSQIIFFGTIQKQKNIRFLVDLLKELNRTYKFKLIILGAVLDEEYKLELKSYIKDNDMDDFVEFKFVKNAEDVAKIIAGSKFALFPFSKAVSIRNTSILAAIVQNIITIIYSNDYYYPDEFRTENLIVLDSLDIKLWETTILDNIKKKRNILCNNDSLVKRHISGRQKFYLKILTDGHITQL
jgi:Glycosyltransferase